MIGLILEVVTADAFRDKITSTRITIVVTNSITITKVTDPILIIII